MYNLYRNIIFIVGIIITTGVLLFSTHYVYFSESSRAFSIVSILFFFIIYSNILAKLYELTRDTSYED